MADEQRRKLMHAALDEELTLEAQQQLTRQLEGDPQGAEEYDRLKQVDRLLRTAPMQHAPENLALKIMARLAQGLTQQPMTQTMGLALALGLSLMTLLLLPLLAAMGYLILTALSDAAAMNGVIQRLLDVVGLLLNALRQLVEFSQEMISEYPQIAMLLLTLIPVALGGLVRAARQETAEVNESA
jgi:anti-sigma factor RsiW